MDESDFYHDIFRHGYVGISYGVSKLLQFKRHVLRKDYDNITMLRYY
jgi:hypothetical protein